jgi:hypothetical protein
MSVSAQWHPLSQRDDPPLEEILYEGAPPHLLDPLLSWITDHIQSEMVPLVAIRLRLDLRQPQRAPNDLWALRWHAAQSEALLLDMVDLMLALLGDADYRAVTSLSEILTMGGSAWRVSSDGCSLERRVDETVRAAAEAAATPGTSSATHLAAAWESIYGRNPNPSRAYSESIKAVEAVAIPVVSPRSARATLGTVIGDLDNQQGRWQFAIAVPSGTDPSAPLLTMLRLLWNGQTDRHGSAGPTIPPSAEVAATAVHLAATLVQWFRGGAITRCP